MNVAQYPSAGEQPPAAMVPMVEHERVCRERDHWRQTAEEQDQIIQQQAATIERDAQERTAIFAVFKTKGLTLAEKVDGMFTIFDARYDGTKASEAGRVAFPSDKVPAGSREVCIRSIAAHAGRSDDAVRTSMARLAKFGLWEKITVTGYNTEQERPQDVTFVRLPGEDLVDDLRALARLAPTEEERRAVTAELEPRTNGKGRGKPGAAPGEKREKTIKAACPDCGSSDTRLDCRSCGSRHNTVDLPNASEQPGADPEAVTYGTGTESRDEGASPVPPQPQLTAENTGSKATVSYGCGDPIPQATRTPPLPPRDGLSPPDGGCRPQAPPPREAPPPRADLAERCACGRLYVTLGDGRRRCNGCH